MYIVVCINYQFIPQSYQLFKDMITLQGHKQENHNFTANLQTTPELQATLPPPSVHVNLYVSWCK